VLQMMGFGGVADSHDSIPFHSSRADRWGSIMIISHLDICKHDDR